QNANLVLAGPTSGGAVAPTFRSLVAADIPTLTTANLPALTAATFWLGNASNGTAAVSMTGDASMASTGVVSVTGIQGKAVSATAPTANQILQFNGTSWIPTTSTALSSTLTNTHIFVGNASGIATDVAMSGDATIDNTGALTLNTVPVTKGGTGVTSYTLGQVPVYDGTKLTGLACGSGLTLVGNGTTFACGVPSASGSTLAAGDIWVGNSSGLAVAVAPAGDVTMDNTGAFTVAKLQTKSVTISSLSANQILQYNGSAWLNVTPTYQSSTLNNGQLWM